MSDEGFKLILNVITEMEICSIDLIDMGNPLD